VAWSAAILGSLLLCTTACGGASSQQPTTSWQAIAAAVKSRLTAAGYTFYVQHVPAPTAAGGAPAGVPLPSVQMPLVPPGAPNPSDAFWVQVDWTSPQTFRLQVLVFRSPAEADGAAGVIAAESAAACKRSAARARCTSAYQQRLSGPVVYTAYTEGQKQKLDFTHLVALASGKR
jgi:hypothetical protein